MRCMEKAVEQTRDEAYAHHIQRLTVTGTFGLLAGASIQTSSMNGIFPFMSMRMNGSKRPTPSG